MARTVSTLPEVEHNHSQQDAASHVAEPFGGRTPLEDLSGIPSDSGFTDDSSQLDASFCSLVLFEPSTLAVTISPKSLSIWIVSLSD